MMKWVFQTFAKDRDWIRIWNSRRYPWNAKPSNVLCLSKVIVGVRNFIYRSFYWIFVSRILWFCNSSYLLWTLCKAIWRFLLTFRFFFINGRKKILYKVVFVFPELWESCFRKVTANSPKSYLSSVTIFEFASSSLRCSCDRSSRNFVNFPVKNMSVSPF